VKRDVCCVQGILNNVWSVFLIFLSFCSFDIDLSLYRRLIKVEGMFGVVIHVYNHSRFSVF
jgi:hypothetical protein